MYQHKIAGVSPITKWYNAEEVDGKMVKKGYNHHEDGHSKLDYPTPFDKSFSNQVAWKNSLWIKEYAFVIIMEDNMRILTDGGII